MIGPNRGALSAGSRASTRCAVPGRDGADRALDAAIDAGAERRPRAQPGERDESDDEDVLCRGRASRVREARVVSDAYA